MAGREVLSKCTHLYDILPTDVCVGGQAHVLSVFIAAYLPEEVRAGELEELCAKRLKEDEREDGEGRLVLARSHNHGAGGDGGGGFVRDDDERLWCLFRGASGSTRDSSRPCTGLIDLLCKWRFEWEQQRTLGARRQREDSRVSPALQSTVECIPGAQKNAQVARLRSRRGRRSSRIRA